MKWTLIRNPTAFAGKSLECWPRVRDLLVSLQIDFEELRAEQPGQAIILTRKAIKEGSRGIMVIGEDPTVNEVANGIMGQSICSSLDILLTQIPIDPQNNWSRNMGIPHKLSEWGNLFKNGVEIVQDVGLVSWKDEAGHPIQRYFINMANIGFDAHVSKISRQKGKNRSYIPSLLSGLQSYKTSSIELKIDNQSKDRQELFALSIGICKNNGAGVLQCPEAVYDDGFLEINLLNKMSKIQVIMNLLSIAKGRFFKNKNLQQYRGHNIEIMADKNTILKIDGELIGSGDALFNILPKQLKVLGLK